MIEFEAMWQGVDVITTSAALAVSGIGDWVSGAADVLAQAAPDTVDAPPTTEGGDAAPAPATNGEGAGDGAGGTAPAPSQPGPIDFIRGLGPFILILPLLYFLLIAPKRKKEKEQKTMLNALKRGDNVQTIGGILGKVVEVREDEVVIKVDESQNTKLRFSRNAIHRVFGEESSSS